MNKSINQDTDKIVTYKCKNCGNDLVFNTSSGNLQCGSCNSEFAISEFEKVEVEEFEKIVEKTTTTNYDEQEVREFNCDNCGAVLVTDAHTASTNCNYCGSSMMINARLSGDVAPAQVIPFKISQDAAQEALKKWCRNGLVTPNDFLTEKRLRNLEGLYVPFWLYDVNATAEGEAICTRIRTYSTSSHIVTETRYYSVYRRVTADYVKIPADASEKLDDGLMDLLEPFNYKELKPFNSAYLSGYCSEMYNYDDKELFPRIQERTNQFITSYMRSTIRGYNSVNIPNARTNSQQRDSVYTLFPIYVINYKYKEKNYTFAMNGQTGKISGKPPICIAKVLKFFFLIFFGSLAVGELIYWLVGKFI